MIYLDNHSTTRVDPQVIAAMQAMMEFDYANAGSTTHAAGRDVAARVRQAIQSIASCLYIDTESANDELVMTSGATESNNLAIFGICLHPRQKRRQVASVVSEHRAVLDPLDRLRNQGFEVVLLPVFPQGHALVGQIDLEQAACVISEETALVTVMHSNNEIGSYQPIRQLSEICHRVGTPLHTDATQTIGHEPLRVEALGCDLMSFSAHKFYGPKGIGGLYVSSQSNAVRLHPQILGGGQQMNRRSGTINTAAIIGMSEAFRRCQESMTISNSHDQQLRNQLWDGLQSIAGERVVLNGPSLTEQVRLARNLNVEFQGIEGQTLMLKCDSLCMSSGSACTSADPFPSHVLQAIGLTADQARCSIRFGVGRFTTTEEIDQAIDTIAKALKSLS